MRYRTLKQVAELFGGVPSYDTLKRWSRLGLIEVSKSIGGGRFLMTEAQIQALREQMETSDGRP